MGRLREYGTISEKISSEKDNKQLKCSSVFDPNSLPLCTSIKKDDIKDFRQQQFCTDSNGKLTGQFCENSACVNGSCVVY